MISENKNIIYIESKRRMFESETFNIQVNNQIESYIAIFEKGSNKVHPFSNFFIDTFQGFSLLNMSYNTKKNFYEHYIIRFLNFIFNDSKNKITEIEELNKSHAIEFLSAFSRGLLPNDNLGKWRSPETVKRADHAINYFMYWLWCGKNRKTKKKWFNMKNLSKEDFFINEIKTKSKNNSYRVKKTLSPIEGYIISKNLKKRKKDKLLSEYGVNLLIEIAERNDPMLVFGIILGAFAGLRVGQIVQMSKGRLIGFNNKYATSYYIDFSYDEILRDKAELTGSIKKKRELLICEGHNEVMRIFYKNHMEYLKQLKLNNQNGAIFIDKNGEAMNYKTYLNRFRAIKELFIIAIKDASMKGDIDAIKEEAILEECEWKVTPHSLRYFFTQQLERYNFDIMTIKLYRVDDNSKSQDIYRKGITPEQIRMVTDHVHEKFIKDRV